MMPLAVTTAYATVIRPDVLTDGRACYVAEHPELPGCVAYGATPGDAEAALTGVRDLYLATMGEAPEPRGEFGAKVLIFPTEAAP